MLRSLLHLLVRKFIHLLIKDVFFHSSSSYFFVRGTGKKTVDLSLSSSRTSYNKYGLFSQSIFYSAGYVFSKQDALFKLSENVLYKFNRGSTEAFRMYKKSDDGPLVIFHEYG